MQAKIPTPAEKQRVRTGCITCRKRRRKCDERKPECKNCEAKGLPCKYGVNVKFMEPSNPGPPERESAPSQRHNPSYARLKFLDGRPKASTRPTRKSRVEAATAELSRETGVVNRAVEADSGSPSRTGQNDNDGLFVEQDSAPPIQRRVTDSPGESFSSSKRSIEEVAQDVTSQGGREAELLCQYRYQIAPWIDIGNSKSSFGIELLLEAKKSKPVLDAILQLTVQRNLACSSATAQHRTELGFANLRAAEDVLEVSSGPVQRAVGMLSMLQDLITSEPQQWRPLIISHKPKYDGLPVNGIDRSLDEAIFWVYLKIDLAASLVVSEAPLISTLSHIQRNNSGSISGTTVPILSETAFHNVLLLLARSLTVLFGNRPSVQSPEQFDAAPFAPFQSPPLSTRWITLWSENQNWYADRPVELRQVYEVRSAEVSRVDMGNQASFPVIIFTTSLALLANIVHHITSILLLSNRPRLVKSLTGPRTARSCLWHAQHIAGIAESNDSPEHGDPLMVAGLFLAAKSMSHESQQATILDTLHRIRQSTGMKLDDELHAMKSDWQIARDG